MDDARFGTAVVTCIFVNTVVLSIEHKDQPVALEMATRYINLVFTFVFAIELAIKLAALGPVAYFVSKVNVFDCVIVLVSLAELGTGQSGLTVLRSFRLLRIFTALRALPTMRRQLAVMIKTLDSVLTFMFLLGLFVFMAAIAGMRLFGQRYARL